jgi:hypothetical protein
MEWLRTAHWPTETSAAAREAAAMRSMDRERVFIVLLDVQGCGGRCME